MDPMFVEPELPEDLASSQKHFAEVKEVVAALVMLARRGNGCAYRMVQRAGWRDLVDEWVPSEHECAPPAQTDGQRARPLEKVRITWPRS